MRLRFSYRSPLLRLAGDRGGASAVEFAIVAAPFLLTVLWIFQVCLLFMGQTSLDTGVNNAADYLRSSFAKASPTYPDAPTLKAKIALTSGGLIRNDSTLMVDLRPLSKLGSAIVVITDETTPDYGAAGDTLVLRAQTSATLFAPGFSSLAQVQSSAIVRRKTN
jgi:Flp pilus assembly protein TadG